MMKRGVVIVNTARGAVMDEAALVEALDGGHIWSCGLDVYEDEPQIHPGLVVNPHVMLLPHMGTWTVEVDMLMPTAEMPIMLIRADMLLQTQTAMEEWNIGNVRAVLETDRLNNVVPEQAGLGSEVQSLPADKVAGNGLCGC